MAIKRDDALFKQGIWWYDHTLLTIEAGKRKPFWNYQIDLEKSPLTLDKLHDWQDHLEKKGQVLSSKDVADFTYLAYQLVGVNLLKLREALCEKVSIWVPMGR